MLTIKHINSKGDEFIVECESFVADYVEGSPDKRFIAHNKPYRDNHDYVGLWYGSPATGGIDDDTIFVMNRFGATVATHRFQTGPSGGVSAA